MSERVDLGADAPSPVPFPAAEADARAARIVFHDGGCPVCRAEIGWYRDMRGAGAIDWVDVASEALPAELPEGYDRERLLKRFTIIRRDGAVVDGAKGFVALWRALGPTRWLGILSDRWPVLPVAELGYRMFLRLRPVWRRGGVAAGPPSQRGS
jgi:predicted DCC family thiol-disulfide oxidoreductase YuxK